MTIVQSPMIRPTKFLLALLLIAQSAMAEELYQAADAATILKAARGIIADDRACALITIDADGIPRARTVTASAPEEDMTIWIATKPNTRKVQQISSNPNVALYFNNDPGFSYVSIMGTATLHNDLETKEAKNFYEEPELKAYWPDYPDDFILIKVTPSWIEVEGHGVTSHVDTWQPQGLDLSN